MTVLAPPLAPRVAFDLDGTLFDCAPGADYESRDSVASSTRPHPRAVATVRRLRDAGYRVGYITGRCTHLRGLTLMRLLQARLPAGPLVLQEKWLGYAAMAHYKAAEIRRMQAVAYVGDHDADEEAARLAGVPFFHANDLRAGRLPLPMLVGSGGGA